LDLSPLVSDTDSTPIIIVNITAIAAAIVDTTSAT
jgi:hypothetical protein